MINRLIKNNEDYNTALSRIEELMDAKAGTSEMDELELLTALVEMYEERFYPINPPDPIEAIRFRMEQLGLGQKDLVPFIGTKSKVSEILSGKRTLTLSMMRSLNKSLGIPAEVLLREPGGNFPNEIQNFDWPRFPVTEMAKRGWICTVEDLKGKAEELMRDFIAQAGGLEDIPLAFFRRGKMGRINIKTDPYALLAWCIRVVTLAKKKPLKTKYVKGSIKRSTFQEIAKLSYFENGPSLACEYLEKNGIHLIVVPHLPKTYLDGAAILLPDKTPVIGLTLRHDRIDNFWFCLLHELAHVSMHLSVKERFIIDDLDLRENEIEGVDNIEREADEMTRDGLIPKKIWDMKPIEGAVTITKVHALATKLKVHPAIIAGRIRYERNNYKLLSRHVGSNQIRKHFQGSFS